MMLNKKKQIKGKTAPGYHRNTELQTAVAVAVKKLSQKNTIFVIFRPLCVLYFLHKFFWRKHNCIK